MTLSEPPVRAKVALTATRVALPPVSSSVPPGMGATTRSAVASDPNLLLDAFDAFTDHHNNTSRVVSKEKKTKADPIEFLNKHFTNEATLVAQLPFIRSAVSERMQRLDDTISSALQRQSESADATQKHVQDARASVASLEQRVKQVQQKAAMIALPQPDVAPNQMTTTERIL